MKVRHKIGLAVAACATFSVALATQASASLNIASSTTVRCVGAGGACTQLEFTLEIPATQTLVKCQAESPTICAADPAPAGTYSNFHLGQYTLTRLSGSWTFGTFVGASPGNWLGSINPANVVVAGVQGTSFPLAPIVFTVNVTGLTDLSQFDVRYGANGVEGVVGYTWSSGGLVSSTVPEPASMILLGTGLMGLMGAARRRRRGNDVENA